MWLAVEKTMKSIRTRSGPWAEAFKFTFDRKNAVVFSPIESVTTCGGKEWMFTVQTSQHKVYDFYEGSMAGAIKTRDKLRKFFIENRPGLEVDVIPDHERHLTRRIFESEGYWPYADIDRDDELDMKTYHPRPPLPALSLRAAALEDEEDTTRGDLDKLKKQCGKKPRLKRT